tara:strand:- start:1686 stop:2186 length:501 start_codon:yes stop_codon:yes gene_type:complete
MQVAQSPNDLLFNLTEIRPKCAVKRFRKSIIQDYPGERCAYCNAPATSWTLDHIIPKSKGGPTRRWNLARCCTHCNGSKSNHQVLPWWRPQTIWDEHREETLFSWMRENSSVESSAMIALEESLKKGTLDVDALQELKNPKPAREEYWDKYCSIHFDAPECLIYEC